MRQVMWLSQTYFFNSEISIHFCLSIFFANKRTFACSCDSPFLKPTGIFFGEAAILKSIEAENGNVGEIAH